MKRLALLTALFSAAFATACGGGSSSGPPPPPPVGNFSNASLNGQYAFSMSGQDANGFFTRAGVFVADGNGHINGGVEDVNTAGGTPTLTFTSSTYSILSNGRGTLNLTNSTGTLTFSIVLASTSQGFIAQTDNIATASGLFRLQNVAAFSLAGISGKYVFDVSGIDAAGNPDSIVGQFESGGGGTIVGGLSDENNGSLSGPVAFSSGVYQLDPVNGPTFGRGTIRFDIFEFVFYIVDSNRILLIETVSHPAATLGDAVVQSTNAPTNDAGFVGSFTLLMGGSSTAGALAQAGRFTSDGNGGLTGIIVDVNDFGSAIPIPQGTISNATFAIDAANPGSGRGTARFVDSSAGTFEFIFYLISPNQGVIQDVSNGIVADGALSAQTAGPVTNSTLAGDYIFNWGGISSNSTTSLIAEADYAGQFALSSATANNISGAMDFSDFSTNQGIFLDIGISGALTIRGNGTSSDGQVNSLSVRTSNSPSATFNFAAYAVNSNTIFLVGTDSERVLVGTVASQP